MKKFIYLIICVITFVPFMASAASFGSGGDIGFSFTTVKGDNVGLGMHLVAGNTYQLPNLIVSNTGNKACDYEMSLSNKSVHPELYPSEEWIIFNPKNFSLESGKSQEVQAKLVLPSDGTKIGRYQSQIKVAASVRGEVSPGGLRGVDLFMQLMFGVEAGNVNPVATSPAEARLRGRILLQVEKNGEAWYVKPENGKRMYMKDGDVAYGMMRTLGLGITNADLEKIPIGFESRFECLDTDSDGLCDKLEDGLGTDKNKADTDGDGFKDGEEVKGNYNPLNNGKLNYNLSLVNKLKGKILLQVESHGEAWYINPVDGKRYYMPDGPSAYQIMKFLSLGISNSNLEKITIE